jgi:hypothetical protein
MALAAALGLAACVMPSTPPRVVDASQPTVTYEYTNDNDLVVATRKAEAYCRDFQAWPETRTITTNQDGTKSVVFECNRTSPPAPLPPVVAAPPVVQPGISYTVNSDTELVTALRSANAYCRQRALQADTINVAPNGDGSRTVSFRCVAA